MQHQRRVIRQAVVALLKAGGTLAGQRVYDSPSSPRRNFPALSVWDLAEDQQAISMPAGPNRAIERNYQFEVRAEVQQADGAAATRDDLLAEVEALLAAAGVVSGIKSITPAGYAMTHYDDGDRAVTVGHQRFSALYYTTQGNPAATL